MDFYIGDLLLSEYFGANLLLQEYKISIKPRGQVSPRDEVVRIESLCCSCLRYITVSQGRKDFNYKLKKGTDQDLIRSIDIL